MIVCHCKAISDRTIRKVVRDGACSIREVARQCDAARGCGGCRPAVQAVIEAEKGESPALAGPSLATAS